MAESNAFSSEGDIRLPAVMIVLAHVLCMYCVSVRAHKTAHRRHYFNMVCRIMHGV